MNNIGIKNICEKWVVIEEYDAQVGDAVVCYSGYITDEHYPWTHKGIVVNKDQGMHLVESLAYQGKEQKEVKIREWEIGVGRIVGEYNTELEARHSL
jgi:hypothetical protein